MLQVSADAIIASFRVLTLSLAPTVENDKRIYVRGKGIVKEEQTIGFLSGTLGEMEQHKKK